MYFWNVRIELPIDWILNQNKHRSQWKKFKCVKNRNMLFCPVSLKRTIKLEYEEKKIESDEKITNPSLCREKRSFTLLNFYFFANNTIKLWNLPNAY